MTEEQIDATAEQAGIVFEQIGPFIHGQTVDTLLTLFAGIVGSMATDKDDLLRMVQKMGGMAYQGMMLSRETGGLGFTMDETVSVQ